MQYPYVKSYELKTTWFKCGAKDCKTGHVDQKRAENCPKRKRALRKYFSDNYA